jgi:hypothetical protein
MPGRFHKLQFAAVLLILFSLAGFCHAEVAEVECTAEGDCSSPDIAESIQADYVPDVSEPDVSEKAVEEDNAEAAAAADDEPVEATPKETAETSQKEEEQDKSSTPAEDPNCPSRAYVIRCAEQYLDTNKNGKLERQELQTAIDTLPWYARGERAQDRVA